MIDQIIEEHHKANFSKFVTRFKRPLNSEHAAEDVVQEAYARALKYKDSYDPTQPFDNWFSSIIRNAFRDALNEERGIVREELNEFNHESLIDDAPMEDLKEALRDSISKESEGYQVVLKLFFFGGYTGREISQVTPYSQTNIRQIVLQFRNKFQKGYTKD